ncbi:MAG TPA: Wzz/FepE/Etk N-terminal domain-containing protein [Anaerolineales bacterium]|nr:Wzz/FepE/Etk N-terminal domain-containing protein [Anaerolineales bacterium]
MTENSLISILRKGWWIILLTTIVAALAALAYTYFFSAPEYRATSRFLISPNAETVEEADMLRSLDTLARVDIIATYAEVFRSARITDAARQAANVSDEYSSNAFNLPETNILVVQVVGPDPRQALVFNQAVNDEALAYLDQIYPVYSLTLLDAPRALTTPIGPDPLRNMGLAVLLGVGLGAILAILRYGLLPQSEPAQQTVTAGVITHE